MRERWIEWVLIHHRWILLSSLLWTLVCGFLASRLEIDNDLQTLLPEHHPVVKSLQEIETSFGSLGSVNIVVKGGSVEQRHAFADAVGEYIKKSPNIRAVDVHLKSDFFTEHALYYLSETELDELFELIQAWKHYELCSSNPDICLDDPDPKAPEQLHQFIREKQTSALRRTSFTDYYEQEDIPALVILVHPKKSSSDLQFSLQVTQEIREAVGEVEQTMPTTWQATDLRWNIVGPYVVKADEYHVIRKDMAKSGIVGVLGVIVVLYIIFRSTRAVFSLLVPLLFGLTWAMAATELLLGHLNTITSLISTVVMGMGIDAGIHFLVRTRHERYHHSTFEAIKRAFASLINPLLVASGTTLAAFAVMASSDFLAFKEFGIIAILGVILCFLAMITVFPAFLYFVGIKVPKKPRSKSATIKAKSLVSVLVTHPGKAIILTLFISIGAYWGARRVSFENNARNLQSDHTRSLVEKDTHLIREIFRKDIHAGILVLDSFSQVQKMMETARQRHQERVQQNNTVIADLFAVPDLLPDVNIDIQQRKQKLEELTAEIPDSVWKKLDQASQQTKVKTDDEQITEEEAKQIKRVLNADPVKLESLPPSILAKVRSEDGKWAIYAYPNFDAADIAKGIKFMEESRQLFNQEAGEHVFVGETTVYATMYLLMRNEAPMIVGLAGLLITICVFLQLRSVVHTILALLPLLVGLWWLIALMGAIDLKFTLFNIPILPAILGIGIDNGIYLSDRLRHVKRFSSEVLADLQETSSAIFAATLTTAAGFAAFIVADSGGLRSIGKLAVCGISIAALTAMIILPSTYVLFTRIRKKSQTQTKL